MSNGTLEFYMHANLFPVCILANFLLPFIVFFPLHQMTCLHVAVEGGHMNTVKYLVDQGVDINTKDDHGVSV